MAVKPYSTRAFRANHRDYDQAYENLHVRGRTMQDYLEAAVRFADRDPDRALTVLAPVWPPARFAGRPPTAVAYAVLDEEEHWDGQPNLLPTRQYKDAFAEHLFEPADLDNPRYGQKLKFRFGDITGVVDEEQISPYAVRVVTADGRTLAFRMTHRVQDVLFGPRSTIGPDWDDWAARREQRQRQRLGDEPDVQA